MSIYEPGSPLAASRMLSVLRIVAGLIYFSAGSTIVFGFPPSPTPMPAMPLMSQMGIGGLLEVVGGALIVLGLFTRPVAFILAGEMAVAYFQFHFPHSFYPTINQGIPAILFCFFYLYLVFAGPGIWSADAAIARSRRPVAA